MPESNSREGTARVIRMANNKTNKTTQDIKSLTAKYNKAELAKLVIEAQAAKPEAKPKDERIYANEQVGFHIKKQDTDYFTATLGLRLEDVIPFLKENVNDKGYVNLYISTRNSDNQLFMRIDNNVPQQKEQQQELGF